MRQLIIFFFSFIVWEFDLQAQTIDSLFVAVPRKHLFLLDRDERLNLIDLYNYKMNAETENSFGGRTIMLEKDSDYVRLQLTDVSQWELKRLYNLVPAAEDSGWEQDPFYAITHTIKSGPTSSRIYFFDKEWHQIFPPFPLVKLSSFWIGNPSLTPSRQIELKHALSDLHVKLSWSFGLSVLNYEVSLDALPLDVATDAATCLRSIRYEWTGQSFVEIP